MTITYNEKPLVSINEQQPPINDNTMLYNDRPPPSYSEKIPTTIQQPISNEKELASPSPCASSAASLEEVPTTVALTGKQLKFHHASFPWRSVNVSSSTGQPLYYAEISEATPKKPDVNLRAPDKNGATVGRSHFRLSRSMRAGIGRDDLDLEWTEFSSSSIFNKGGFDFVWDGRSYRLERTRSKADGVEGMQKANLNHYKVVDVHSGEVVAVYVSETYHPARMIGKLTLKEGMSAGLEVLIVLGVLGWREKTRRMVAYSGQNGGGS